MSVKKELLLRGSIAVLLVGMVFVIIELVPALYNPGQGMKGPLELEYGFATISGEVPQGKVVSIADKAIVQPNSSSLEDISVLTYLLDTKLYSYYAFEVFRFPPEESSAVGARVRPWSDYDGYSGTINGSGLSTIEIVVNGRGWGTFPGENVSLYAIGVESKDINATLYLPTGETVDLGRSHTENAPYRIATEGSGLSGGGVDSPREWNATGYWQDTMNRPSHNNWRITFPEIQRFLKGSSVAKITFDILVRFNARYELSYAGLIEAGDINVTTRGRLVTLEINYSDGKILQLKYEFSVLQLRIMSYKKPVEGRSTSELAKAIQGSEAYARGDIDEIRAENIMKMFNLRKEGFKTNYRTSCLPDQAPTFKVGDKVLATGDLGQMTINATRVDGSPFYWSGPAVPKGTNGVVIHINNAPNSSECVYSVRFQGPFGDIIISAGAGQIVSEDQG